MRLNFVSITREHGRKKAWLHHLCSSVLLSLGVYDRFRKVRWADVRRVVFVCKGNICRSAYCEAAALRLGLPAVSRGLQAGVDGSSPKILIDLAAARGVNLSQHRPKQFQAAELLAGDLVLAMEPGQAKQIEQQIRMPGIQISLLGLWHNSPRVYLQDPYGMDRTYIEHCIDFMEVATQRLNVMLTETLDRSSFNEGLSENRISKAL